MARCYFSGVEELERQLGSLDRDVVKGIVMAGADAAAKEMRRDTEESRHVDTHSMKDNIGPAEFHEDIGAAWTYVYPQGLDSRGVSNALKAYVINHGLGKRPNTVRSGEKKKNRTGDKFITKNERRIEQAVEEAMQAERDRRIAEINGR